MTMYTAIVLITVTFLFVTIVDICTNRLVNKKMKQYSIVLCLVIGFAAFCEWLGVKTNGADVSFIYIHELAKLIEFCLSPIAGVIAAFTYSKVKKPFLMVGFLTIHILLEIVFFHFKAVFYVDSNNIYHRNYLYWVYIVAFGLSILYCFFCIVREELKYHSRPDLVLIATLIFLAVGIGIQMIKSNIRVDYLCVAIGNFLLYNHRCKTFFQMDGLTHLLNRRCYEKDIEKLSSPAIIINMDVNKFKDINDAYGHTIGDYYLKSIAKIIYDTYGKFGSCYRYGGDEFCVTLFKVDKLDELNQQFINSINDFRKKDKIAPSVSIGYAHYNSKETHIQSVIEQADKMMYENKNNLR